MTDNIEENAWLEGKEGDRTGKRLDLQRGETLVGRGSACHLQIKDPKISRMHASIKVEVTGLTITDLGSTSGTFVNDKRVTSKLLKAGDVIRLGDSSFTVCFKQDSIPTVLDSESVVQEAPAQVQPEPAPTPVDISQVTPSPVPPPAIVPPVTDRAARWKPFAIGCGGLLALALCLAGTYLVYDYFFAYEEPLTESDLSEITLEDIAGDIDEPEPDLSQTEPTPEAVVEPMEEESGEVAGEESDQTEVVIRPYDRAADEYLYAITGNAEWDKEISTPGYAYYSGTWNEGEPGWIATGWCADTQETLDATFPHVNFELILDGMEISIDELDYDQYDFEVVTCYQHRAVVEGLPPGNHTLIEIWNFDSVVTDGFMEYGPDSETTEFRIEVLPWISVLDSFDEGIDDWDQTQQSNFNLIQGDGIFTIEIFNEFFTAWSLYKNLEMGDVDILTSAVRMSEQPGAYGIVFRYQDVNNFYYFRVDDAGYFEVGKRVAGEFIPLVGPSYSDLILQKGENNKLALLVDGEMIQALINFEVVASVSDQEFSTGQLGMLASTPLGTDTFKVDFDYYSIEAEDISR